MRATQRLIARGFEAYLVGGCVRDLLLGRSPKDYDLATEARPPQIKRTFPRNCRIIGRRFKLAHLHFENNTKILEVSTFRRTPQGDSDDADLLITRDNEFGTAEEDAMRRDFTVNALFLDPTRDCILDYCEGLEDVRKRVIRTIGDPVVRFREDPVRILRAVKFAGRLGFSIEPATFAAMAETAGDLARAAPPRVLEEILRLLRGGHALDSFQLLRDVGALRTLVPVVAEFLATAAHAHRVAFWRLLEALDHQVQEGHVPGNAVLLAVLFVEPVLAVAENNPGRSPSSIAEQLLGSLGQDLRLPRRDAGCLKRICGVQHRFTVPEGSKRFRTAGFIAGPYFDEAFELFALRAVANGDDLGVVERWRALADGTPHARHDDDVDADSETPIDADDIDVTAAAADDGDADTADAGAEVVTADETDADGERPRKKRRRRRGRGRGRERAEGDDDGDTEPDALPPVHAAANEAETGDDEAGDDATGDDETPQRRTAADLHGDEHDDDASEAASGGDADSSEADRSDADSSDADSSDADDRDAVGHDEGERKRRRRRRRRRGGRRDDETFPRSAEPAPHGDAVDPDTQHLHVVHAHDDELPETFPADHFPADHEAVGDAAAGDDETTLAEGDDDGQHDDAGTATVEGDRKRRRRRRRGRRDRGDEPRQADGRQPSNQPPARPRDERRREQQPREQQPTGQRSGEPRHGDQRQGEQRHGEQRQGEQRPGGGKKSRDERRGRRDKRRGDRGHGSPRDVDVVPRYRDRRGKVEVLEPQPLDLSAFDVELDPKRVPTFGSIVEGKGRPKRRSPRVPEDGNDKYRPPPPPGSSSGPGAPPPPPPADDDGDTFGDW